MVPTQHEQGIGEKIMSKAEDMRFPGLPTTSSIEAQFFTVKKFGFVIPDIWITGPMSYEYIV